MAEFEGGTSNWACLVNCLGDEGDTATAKLLTELTGRAVQTRDCDQAVPWKVDNKYYCAQVQLVVCSHDSRELGEREWEALVLLFSLTELDSLKTAINTWEHVEKQGTPPVCLLVGVTENVGGISCRQQALQWCVKCGFELIEWEREPQPSRNGGGGEVSEEDDFPESVGVERISEALQAHVWPDIEMKSTVPGERSTVKTMPHVVNTTDVRQEETQFPATERKTAPSKELDPSASASALMGTEKESTQKRIDGLFSEEEELLASGLNDKQDPGGESFEKLFAKFAQMKAHAELLQHEERKEYAEKVVMAFWKAIGGDEDEVDVEDNS